MSEGLLRKIWKILFCLSALCFVWLLGEFSVKFYTYVKLSGVAPVEILEWKPLEVKSEKFLCTAHYSFENQGKIIEGVYRFDKPLFANRASCVATMEKLSQKSWTIFFNPQKVEQVSLQRFFPFQKGIHALLALAVFLYFVWFRDYLIRLLPENERETKPIDPAT